MLAACSSARAAFWPRGVENLQAVSHGTWPVGKREIRGCCSPARVLLEPSLEWHLVCNCTGGSEARLPKHTQGSSAHRLRPMYACMASASCAAAPAAAARTTEALRSAARPSWRTAITNKPPSTAT